MSIQLINAEIVLAYHEYDIIKNKENREPIREKIGHLFEKKRVELCLIELEKEKYVIDRSGKRRGPKIDDKDYLIKRFQQNLIKRDLRK
jgi:hypothetical protein